MPVPPSEHAHRVREFALEQPAALRATLRALAQERIERFAGACREVLLVGSGTSKNAVIATAPTFRRSYGCPVTVAGPLEFLADAAAGGPGTLAVVVSQTGSSTTTVEALEVAQARGGRVIAVTAEAGSPFGRAANEPWLLPIGPEAIGPKTKGYTATLAALLGLAGATAPTAAGATAADADLPADPEAYAAWFASALPDWEALGTAWAERFHDADHVMLVGAGRHLGTALEASLKLQEMAGMPCSAFDLEEALHGRFHGLGPRSLAAFVVGDPDDEARAVAAATALDDLGVPTLVVAAGDGIGAGVARLIRYPLAGAAVDLLAAIVPFQFFADRAARLRGVDPDAMRYPDMSRRLGIKLPSA